MSVNNSTSRQRHTNDELRAIAAESFDAADEAAEARNDALETAMRMKSVAASLLLLVRKT